jgi:RES domain
LVNISRPPVDNNIKIDPIFYHLNPGDTLIRIHNQKYDPIFFNHRPRDRFDHHDGLSNRGVFYAAPIIASQYEALANCILEIFGNTRIIDNLQKFNVGEIKITREVKLLDLRGAGAMRAGTVSEINTATDRQLTQEWGRFFYENEIFGQIDGIIYPSSYSGEPLIILYEERAFDSLEVVSDRSSSDPIMSEDIIQIANHFQLAIAPSVVLNSEEQNSGSSVAVNRNNSVASIDILKNENFDFLDRAINIAVSNAQKDLLKKDIGYVYSRDNMLIQHNPDDSEELIQYLLDIDPVDRIYTTSAKVTTDY